MNDLTDIRARVSAIVTQRYGRSDERLMATGIIDSLSAVDLAITLEQEFRLDADSFALSDMATVTSVSERIARARPREG